VWSAVVMSSAGPLRPVGLLGPQAYCARSPAAASFRRGRGPHIQTIADAADCMYVDAPPSEGLDLFS